MHSYRTLLAVVAGCCSLGLSALRADDAPPFTIAKQFSADQMVRTQDGTMLSNKMFMDNGKIRTEMNANGMQIVSIVRPDLQKVYSLMTAQKMAMVMPYDPDKYKKLTGAASPDGKFELIGSDTVEGVACTKYKVTGSEGNIMDYWINDAKVPVKMAAEDGSVTIFWKNYQVGPQNPLLFEVPLGFQVMVMPAPGGPAGGGQ